MSPRYVPVIVGAAGFVVTLLLCAWREDFWQWPAESPSTAAQPARPSIVAPLAAVSVNSRPLQPDGPSPAGVPSPTPNDDRATVTDESSAASADEREASESRRDTVRGARTR
jgi:hypothetical protein